MYTYVGSHHSLLKQVHYAVLQCLLSQWGGGGGVILPLLPVQINVGTSSNLRPKGWQFQQLKTFSFQLSCIGVGDGVSNVKVVSYDGQGSVRQAILNADSSFVLLYFY